MALEDGDDLCFICPTTGLPVHDGGTVPDYLDGYLDCPFCTGEDCAQCWGRPRPWDQRCEHDVMDRHEGAGRSVAHPDQETQP